METVVPVNPQNTSRFLKKKVYSSFTAWLQQKYSLNQVARQLQCRRSGAASKPVRIPLPAAVTA